MNIRAGLPAALSLTLALLPQAADAQSYRCVGKDGKKYYGSSIPPQCAGQAVEQLSAQGTVLKRIEAQESPEERARKEAATKREAETAAATKETVRRNRALLATYSSEKDIQDARARALGENQRATKDVEARIEAVRAKRTGFARELASVKAGTKPSAALTDDARNADIDLKAQEDLLAAKKAEGQTINARYDSDLQRFRELGALDAGSRGKALGRDKGSP